MTYVIAYHERRAAHGLHRCVFCREQIAAREVYADMRVIDAGTCFTQRQHLQCLALVNGYASDNGIDDDEWVDWPEVLQWATEQPTHTKPKDHAS